MVTPGAGGWESEEESAVVPKSFRFTRDKYLRRRFWRIKYLLDVGVNREE